MKTPQTITLTLAAGTRARLSVSGNYLHVLTCTAASCQFAFDEEALQTVYPGLGYRCEGGFQELTFRDSLGFGCIIVVVAADLPIEDARNSGFTAAMANSLAAIDIDTNNLALMLVQETAIAGDTVNLDTPLSNIETLLTIPNSPLGIPAADGAVACPISGGAPSEVQLVVGSADSRIVFIQALDVNVGLVYLRFRTGVTNIAYNVRLRPGDTWREKCQWGVWACSDNGSEAVCGYDGRIV
jgi:hypothetical protein